jgi:hypothetical protein
MPMELVRNLPYDHPYRWDGTLFGGPKLWRPTEISTALWLDAEDASTITLNGSTVSQWNDKSGNGRNATQATAASQPGYNTSGINSKPALTWSGANNIFLDTPAWSLAPNRKYATVAVAASPTWGGGNRYGRIWVSRSGYPQGYLGQGELAGTALAIAGTTLTDTFRSGVSGTNILSSSFGTTGLAADSFDISVNGGTSSVRLNNTGALGTTGVRIGADLTVTNGGNTWDGQIGEIIIISGDLTLADRQRLEGYLAWKWGLESNLPANHPYKLLPPTV